MQVRHREIVMETSTAKIVKRLKRDGWTFDRHGSSHDIYRHPMISGIIEVQRHIEVSPGVWRSIAKKAGWSHAISD